MCWSWGWQIWGDKSGGKKNVQQQQQRQQQQQQQHPTSFRFVYMWFFSWIVFNTRSYTCVRACVRTYVPWTCPCPDHKVFPAGQSSPVLGGPRSGSRVCSRAVWRRRARDLLPVCRVCGRCGTAGQSRYLPGRGRACLTGKKERERDDAKWVLRSHFFIFAHSKISISLKVGT